MIYQNTIGLDIREDSIAILALKSVYHRSKIVAGMTFSYDAELPVDQKVNLIGEVFSGFLKKNNLRDPDIHVSIPREKVILRSIQMPLAVKENLRTTLSYEIQKYVPLAVNEIYFDYLIYDQDRSNNTLGLILFVVKKSDLDPYVALSDLTGCALSGVQIWPTAISAVLTAHPPEDVDGRIGVVRMNGRTSDVSIYRDSILERNRFLSAQTEKASLADETAKLIEMFDRDLTLETATDAVSWYYVEEGATSDRSNDIGIPKWDIRAMALRDKQLLGAYGLALQGARNEAVGINFLPVEKRKKPNRIGYYILFALTVLTIAAGVSWGASVFIRHRMEVNSLDAQLLQLKSRIAEIENLANEAADMKKQIRTIDMLTRRQVSALQVLETLSVLIPADTWIQELRMKPDGLQLIGISDTASDLLAILEDSPLFKDAVFISTITKDKDGKERFRIGLSFEQ